MYRIVRSSRVSYRSPPCLEHHPPVSRSSFVSRGHLCFHFPNSKVKVLPPPPPRFRSSHPSALSALFLGFFSTTCVSDATSEPILRTWGPRRLCLSIPFGWIPPPSPCAMGSGCRIGWPH